MAKNDAGTPDFFLIALKPQKAWDDQASENWNVKKKAVKPWQKKKYEKKYLKIIGGV